MSVGLNFGDIFIEVDDEFAEFDSEIESIFDLLADSNNSQFANLLANAGSFAITIKIDSFQPSRYVPSENTIYLNKDDWIGDSFIDYDGNRNSIDMKRVLTHELVHALAYHAGEGLDDPRENYIELGSPDGISTGSVVDLTNEILAEFGYPPRAHYWGGIDVTLFSNSESVSAEEYALISKQHFTLDANGDSVEVDNVWVSEITEPVGNSVFIDKTISEDDDLVVSFDTLDIIKTGAGNDFVYSAGGNDIVDLGVGDDFVNGGSGDDILTGAEGADRLYGGDGDDILRGGSQESGVYDDGVGDYLNGGLGNDTYWIDFENSTNRNVHTEIVFGPGNKSAVRSGLEDYVDVVRDEDGLGSLKYTDGNGDVQTLKGYTFFQFAFGVGPNGWSNQNGGLEYVWGVLPDTTVNGILSWSGRMLATPYSWTDSNTGEMKQGLLIFYDRGSGDPVDQEEYQAIVIIENFKNGDFGLILPGFDAVHQGTDAPDDINAGTEDDQVDGGGGDDNLNGEEGDDTIEGGEGADLINGGSGSDTASYEDSDAGVTVNLQTGIGTGGHAEGDQLANIENLIGSNYNDTLIGDDNDNRFAGGLGADFIDGGAGIDTISYYLDGTFENGFGEPGITINLEAGTASGLHAEGDILVNIENVIGTAAEDTLIGDTNDNVLDGEDSVDAMHGGGGNDTIYMDKAAEFALSSGGDGIDTIIFENDFSFDTLDFDLGSRGFENFITDDKSHHRIYGSDVANHIEGDRGNQKFYGYGGDDTLVGGGGTDQLFGGDGADLVDGGDDEDVIDGGSGDDTLFGGEGDDIIDGGAGDDTINGGDGNDVIDGRNGVDVIFGGAYNDTISGQNKNDVISGDGGEDVLYGNRGNDTLLGGDDNDTLYGGASADELSGQDGEDHLFGGGQADRLYGGQGNDVLDGGSGNDFLSGGSGDDILFGGSGIDVLEGNKGSDILRGGLGIDFLTGGSDASDIFEFDVNDGGLDTITDYQDGLDMLRFTGGITLDGITVSDHGTAGEDALIEVAGTDISILLQNVDHTLINPGDFAFA